MLTYDHIALFTAQRPTVRRRVHRTGRMLMLVGSLLVLVTGFKLIPWYFEINLFALGLLAVGLVSQLFSPRHLQLNLGSGVVSLRGGGGGPRRLQLTPGCQLDVSDADLAILVPGDSPVRISSTEFSQVDLQTLATKLRALAARGELPPAELEDGLEGVKIRRQASIDLSRGGWVLFWLVFVPAVFAGFWWLFSWMGRAA